MMSDTVCEPDTRPRADVPELPDQAMALFGARQMRPDQADSPARRIYFALQSACLAQPGDRRQHLASAHAFILDFRQATTSASARDLLDAARDAADHDAYLQALICIVRIIRHEDAVLGRRTGP